MSIATSRLLAPNTLRGVRKRFTVRQKLTPVFENVGVPVVSPTREYNYDTFDDTRQSAPPSRPGNPANVINPQPVGNVQVTLPYLFYRMPLLYAHMGQFRDVGGVTLVDGRGRNYIMRQVSYAAQRQAAFRELLYLGMLHGELYFDEQENGLTDISTSAGETKLDWQIPAGNKDQLDIDGTGDIIDANWLTDANADIPLHIDKMIGAIDEKTGLSLKHFRCNHTLMNAILQNNKVKALAGTANRVAEERVRNQNDDFVTILSGIPYVTWHVTSGSVTSPGGTRIKYFANYKFSAHPDPSPEWFENVEGQSPQVKRLGANPELTTGADSWEIYQHDPASVDLFNTDTFLPTMPNPNCVLFGDVKP